MVLARVSARPQIEQLQNVVRLLDDLFACPVAGAWEWHLDNDQILLAAPLRHVVGLGSETSDIGGLVDLVHPEDRAIVDEHVDRARRTQVFDHCEFRVIDSQQNVRWIAAHGEHMPSSGRAPRRLVGIAREVTAQREFLSALHTTIDVLRAGDVLDDALEHTYREAQSLTHTGHWAWHADSDTIEWSPELYRLLGKDSATYTPAPRTNAVLYHPDDGARLIDAINDAISGYHHLDFEVRVVAQDGRIKFCHARGRMQAGAGSGRGTFFGTLQDVTDLRALGARPPLLPSVTRETAAMAAMTGGIAHHFNNLLAVVLGYTELARRNLEAGKWDRIGEYIETIGAAARDGHEIVAKLHLAAGPMPGASTVSAMCAPAEVLARAAELAHQMMPPTVAFSVNLDESLPPSLPVGSDALHMIVQNVLANAANAAGANGHIALAAFCRHLNDFVCSCCGAHAHGMHVLISVDDDGAGMTPDVLERAFVPFFSTFRDNRHRGLGLSVVDGLAHVANGHVSLHSEVGRGTRFAVCLPLTVAS